MKSVFDPQAQIEILARLDNLKPGSPALWGRMDAPQMLAHCAEGMRMATGELRVKPGFPILIGWMFKRIATSETPFRHSVPTARELTIASPWEFEAAKGHFMEGWGQLIVGPSTMGTRRHPFFGTLTPEQWGKLVYKHLDHHFRQFGV